MSTTPAAIRSELASLKEEENLLIAIVKRLQNIQNQLKVEELQLKAQLRDEKLYAAHSQLPSGSTITLLSAESQSIMNLDRKSSIVPNSHDVIMDENFINDQLCAGTTYTFESFPTCSYQP